MSDVNITDPDDYRRFLDEVRAGAAHRAPDGTRYRWVSEKPSEDELRNARHRARKRTALIGCAVCSLAYRPEDSGDLIRRYGYCRNCEAFMTGHAPGVLSYRLPTREEALAVPEAERLAMEHHVLNQKPAN